MTCIGLPPHLLLDVKGITSLFAQEVASAVLHELPDMEVVDKTTLQDVVRKDRTETWLIHFVEGAGNQDLELRKLPAMLRGYNVGRADCTLMRSLCNQLHVHKFPTFLLFKANGGQEVYYGSRVTAHDVAAFVLDSADVPLENLSPEDFPDRVVLGGTPWFVDFFAPWCPPCMRLLPEFKKASKHYRAKVNFGTVDCTVHSHLCNMYNIHSYPTTILYNQSKPHQFRGQHNMHSLIEFVQDTLNPPVIALDMSTFGPQVFEKARDDVWLVDFFAPWCGPCNALAPEWRRLAKMFKDKANVHVAHVDCEAHSSLCAQQGVNSYPTIRMYPAGSSGTGQYFKVVKLTYADFARKVLDSAEPWVVDFFAPWCGHCQVFKPEFEKVAEDHPSSLRRKSCRCYPSSPVIDKFYLYLYNPKPYKYNHS
ncbi:Dnaj homolog subfamily c member 10-like [Plakobranchus ocellatus]|uniref:Dnaj homolog subfamily c member 10-like n=1 Tax=Plakobranchus ocellatus TaxID=259542 RepID=A0AAV4AE95_9GAST|nr:Dnaj homolog subfamily c member 10-like [Plakobranchus ocellatus]